MNVDPISFLINLGSSPESFYLVLGPSIVGIGLVGFFVLYYFIRKRAEQQAFEKDLTETSSEIPIEKEDGLKKPVESSVIVEETWGQKLWKGLKKSRDHLQSSLEGIFGLETKLDEQISEKIHESLFRADIGVKTADKLVAQLKKVLGDKTQATWEDVRQVLRAEILAILNRVSVPSEDSSEEPTLKVIMIVGVNGVGKTTTIGKLACFYGKQGKKVMLGAGDTFRAAAIEQLSVWGERLQVPVIKQHQGADPASVAFEAVKAAKAQEISMLILDTAGRLHSKGDLMAELGKIRKSLAKDCPGAPHETWLVLDATSGQNAVAQVKAFQEVTPLTGLVITKLDGTAKGGVLIAIADLFNLPIKYIGVGEKADDLRPFHAGEFVENLF